MPYSDYKLTENEEEALLEFRNYVLETYSSVRKQSWDDWILLRFCRARKFKIKDVKKMFDNYVEFYKDYDLDNIIDFYKDGNEDYNIFLKYSSQHHVFSKQYDAVCFDFRNHYNDYENIKMPTKSFIRHFVKLFEEAKNVRYPILSKKAGRRIDRQNFVVQMKDAPLKQFFDSKVRSQLIETINVVQDIYPETLGKILIINPPFIFHAVYAIVKPFLAQATKEKVQLLSGNEVNKTLQSWIDKDMLPEEYGGNLKIDHSKKYDYFDSYLNECYKKGTYILEDGIYEKEKGIFPPDDPLERANTIDPDYKPIDPNKIIKEQKNSNACDNLIHTPEEEFSFTDENIPKIHMPSSKSLHLSAG